MSEAYVDDTKLTAIGNGVRHVTGGSSLLTLDQMATNLMAMQKTDSMSFTPVYTPPTWADGSWSDIAIALAKHYDTNDDFDIHDYWSVGDTRTVHLNAMAATYVGESHVAQDVEIVLMSPDHYDMTDNSGKAAFVWGLKNFLADGTTGEYGYMNSSNTNSGGWDSSARRTWCNSVFKTALPSDFQALLKQVQIVTADGSSSTTATSVDYIFLPAEKEIFGSVTYANSTAESSLTQYEWYATAENHIKKAGASGDTHAWWERSPYSNTSFCIGGATPFAYNANGLNGLAPCGCI